MVEQDKITLGLIILLVLLLITASFITRKNYSSDPCPHFDKNTPVAQLPARCIKYFTK